MNEQRAKNRKVLHLLYYTPERRGTDFDVIEDIVPLYNTAVSIRVPGTIRSVTLAPQQVTLPFKQVNGRIEFTLPELKGHQMVVFS
jgi:hypothetical protein